MRIPKPQAGSISFISLEETHPTLPGKGDLPLRTSLEIPYGHGTPCLGECQASDLTSSDPEFASPFALH